MWRGSRATLNYRLDISPRELINTYVYAVEIELSEKDKEIQSK